MMVIIVLIYAALIIIVSGVSYFLTDPTTSSTTTRILPDGRTETTTEVKVTEKWESFGKAAGIGFAAVSGLMSVVASLYTMSQQAKSQTQLEILKASLPQQRQAYDQLSSAAVLYYRRLASLEAGAWDPKLSEEAEKHMEEAERHMSFLPMDDEGYRDLWTNFWQKARMIGEKAEGKNSASQRELWLAEAKSLADDLNKIEKMTSAKLNPHN
jgi:hypothetical protein